MDKETDQKIRDYLNQGREASKCSTGAERKEALEHASDFLDLLPYKGERLTSGQRRAWPRKGVFLDDGTEVTRVPEEIKKSAYIVAGFILAKVPFCKEALAPIFLEIGHLLEPNFDIRSADITWH